MLKRLVGCLYVVLGLAMAFAAVSATRWRAPFDAHIARTGAIALGYDLGDDVEALEPHTFAVIRGARASHVRLARALEVAAAFGASPVVVLGHGLPGDRLGRWRIARVVADQGGGIVHLASPTHVPDAGDPLLSTTLSTPAAFAFRAHGCLFRGGTADADWTGSLGLPERADTPVFAFTANGVRPPADAAAAVFVGGPSDDLHPTVELVSVAADGALTRRAVTVPAVPRPVDAWRAFECAFLPLADSLAALLGVLGLAVGMVALGSRLLLGAPRVAGPPTAVAEARLPTRAERRRAHRIPRITAREIQAALRG